MPAGKALRIEAGTTTSDLTDYFSFGGNGTFGIDAMGVSNGRFVVENGGKVGIGTPTPRTALEIQGPLQAGWSPWLMLTNAVGNADVGVAFNTFAPAVTVANNASSVIQAQDMGNFTNDLVFLSNAGGAPSNGLVEKMRITASGNVGIGTASPTATLEVAAAPFELNDYPVVGIQGLAAA